MLPLNTILCPIDFTSCSAEAMKVAVELGQHFKPAVVHILNVVNPIGSVDATEDHGVSDSATTIPDSFQEQEVKLVYDAGKSLDDFVVKYTTPDVTLAPHVQVGGAAELIVSFAEVYSVDLIIMATHGREGLTHFFVGSVAEKVVEKSKVPVLTIRPGQKNN
jgi:nucleotide-binding universal stress UspA family protein